MTDDVLPAHPPAEGEDADTTPAHEDATSAPSPVMPERAEAPATSPRRPRVWARWLTAAAVFAVVCSAVTWGVSGVERTDVPGLATRSDGRWAYPELSLPALPAGDPRPFTEGNDGQIHYADLRRLLLPAPAGATVDKHLDGDWTGPDRYLSEYEQSRRAALRLPLANIGLRHIAARGWTMPDGTTARVYLLQFESAGMVRLWHDSFLAPGATAGIPPTGAEQTQFDPGWPTTSPPSGTEASAYAETRPYGQKQKRLAYIEAGDTLALVVEERKGAAPAVPFHQTLALQEELLA